MIPKTKAQIEAEAQAHAEKLKGLDGTFATVLIKTDAGLVRINAHDHDPEYHGEIVGDAEQLPVASSEEQRKSVAPVVTVDYNKLDKEELKDLLAGKGVAFDPAINKKDLVALVEKTLGK